MTAARFYATVGLLILVGVLCIVVAPELSLSVLIIAIPLSVIGAAVSTVYMARVYRDQPIPRSRFFRMLLESFFALLLIGVWVGYLSFARTLEKAALTDPEVPTIPAPPPNISSPISALIVIIVFGGVIRFAMEVYRVRRTSAARGTPERQSAAADNDDLDRDA